MQGACQKAGGGGDANTAGWERTNTQRTGGVHQKGYRQSSQNTQATWNGVPAGEDKGHPDGATRHKQGEGRERWTAKGGGRQEAAPSSPSYRHTHTNLALQPPRQ